MAFVRTGDSVDYMVFPRDDGCVYRVSSYLGDPSKDGDGPQAFLVDFCTPPDGGQLDAHFHPVPQFQVFTSDGVLGRREIPAMSFHYADADTPYGPLKATHAGGVLSFLTLRLSGTQYTHFMPGARTLLRKTNKREIVAPATEPPPLPESGAETDALIDRHPDGLAAFRVRIAPYATAHTPDASESSGQYQLVTRGSASFNGGNLGLRRPYFIEPGDGEAEISAGSEGAEILVLQFPRPPYVLEPAAA